MPNKFPALQIEGDLNKQGEGIFDKMNGIGAHEVIIEHPDHNATLANLPGKAVEEVLWAYRDRMEDLKKDKRFQYGLVFKNEGLTAGATLEHGHSQVIALPIVPIQVQEELDGSRKHYELKERCIFCGIIRQEICDTEPMRVKIQEGWSHCDGRSRATPYGDQHPCHVRVIVRQTPE